MFENTGYSLADVAAATGNNDGFGNGGAWWIIILFLFCFMGGGWGGYSEKAATANEVQNDFNFASLERQNQGIIDAVHQSAYDVTGAVKDGNAFNQSMMKDIAYDINGELKDNATIITSAVRDVKDVVQANNYELGKGFAAMSNQISESKYDALLNTQNIMKNDCENTQKILDALNANKIAAMEQQINSLQLQAALTGVVRYPLATTYSAGIAPLYGGPGGPGPGPIL